VVDDLLTDEVLVGDFRVKRHVSDGLVNSVAISEVDGDVNSDVNLLYVHDIPPSCSLISLCHKPMVM
jgi:hypothetical protein